MRSFTVGLICGALIYGAVDAWVGRASPDVVEESSRATRIVDRTSTLPHVSHVTEGLSTDRSTRAAQSTSTLHASAGIYVDDNNLHQVLPRLLRRQSEIEKAQLQAEPKDPLWSAAMEQQVHEYIARHRLGKHFSVASVDCRTLFCEIKAECAFSPGGASRNAVDAFNQVIRELAESLDLSVGGGGSGNLIREGVMDAHTHLRRFKPGDACPEGFRRDCWNG